MAITLKRQLTLEEKEIILKRHGRVCFANGHNILENETIHFDHIEAFSRSGETELNNIAPMCQTHNLAKGTLLLSDYRMKLDMEKFFNIGDGLTLQHLLIYLKEHQKIATFGETISNENNNNTIRITTHNYQQEFQLQTCPLTKWRYFYGNLPVELLSSDDDKGTSMGLQPRYLIFDKVFNMYRHFQHYPVLQPSVGRIYKNKILLFDGQHKIAALLWGKRTSFECKIYIDPKLRQLNQANISAHDTFAQTRFYTSVMVQKLGAQFDKDFEGYRTIEDNKLKSEEGFIKYLENKDVSLKSGEINKQFRSYLFNSIIYNEDNKTRHLITKGNRSTDKQPLTVDMLSKSILFYFLYRKPVNDDLLSENYKRDIEVENIIKLLNLLWKLSLSYWDTPSTDDLKNKLKRIYSSKSMMAWSSLLHASVCADLKLHENDVREKPFYRNITPEQHNSIEKLVTRLIDWNGWLAPQGSEIDTIIRGSRDAIRDWFREKGLTTGYLMGAPE